MSDTAHERVPPAIQPARTISARDLSRNTAAALRCVADDGQSLAIKHFGRVIGFIVPVEGRVPVRRGRKIVYEVPEPEPLLELTGPQVDVLRIISGHGSAVPDQLVPPGGTWGATAMTLWELETSQPPLIVKRLGGYRLTLEGERHAEALGL